MNATSCRNQWATYACCSSRDFSPNLRSSAKTSAPTTKIIYVSEDRFIYWTRMDLIRIRSTLCSKLRKYRRWSRSRPSKTFQASTGEKSMRKLNHSGRSASKISTRRINRSLTCANSSFTWSMSLSESHRLKIRANWANLLRKIGLWKFHSQNSTKSQNKIMRRARTSFQTCSLHHKTVVLAKINLVPSQEGKSVNQRHHRRGDPCRQVGTRVVALQTAKLSK